MSKKDLHIIKIGGKLINDGQLLISFLEQFSQLSGPKILVHGGGSKATELSALLGIETRIIDGRRITDKDTLEVAIMVYAGLINKGIVGKLQGLGLQSIGLSGADMGIITSHKREIGDIDYGFVGDIDSINSSVLDRFMRDGVTPVICAITYEKSGQLLNTNADTIASKIATTMNEFYHSRLTYCFEYPGVLYDLRSPELIMNSLSQDEFDQLRDQGIIAKGMIPKLSNGFDALTSGVENVRVCGVNNLSQWDNSTNLVL